MRECNRIVLPLCFIPAIAISFDCSACNHLKLYDIDRQCSLFTISGQNPGRLIRYSLCSSWYTIMWFTLGMGRLSVSTPVAEAAMFILWPAKLIYHSFYFGILIPVAFLIREMAPWAFCPTESSNCLLSSDSTSFGCFFSIFFLPFLSLLDGVEPKKKIFSKEITFKLPPTLLAAGPLVA